MLDNLPSGTDARPVVIEGDVVWLPTLAGLLGGKTPVLPGVGRATLTTSVAAALVADRMIDDLEDSLGSPFTAVAPNDLSSLEDLELMVLDAQLILQSNND